MSNAVRVPGRPFCPKCRTSLDGAGNAESGAAYTPQSGDYSFCVYCETMLVYEAAPNGLALRRMTRREMRKLSPEEREMFDQAKEAVRRVWGPMPRKPSLGPH